MKDGIENHAEQWRAEDEPTEQDSAEQQVDDRAFDLDEQLIVQQECQRAKYEYDDGGHQRHQRQAPGERVGNRKSDYNGDHEYDRPDAYAEAFTRRLARRNSGNQQQE